MTLTEHANMSRPYLSVVVTSRNDNHGGTLQRRMQIFIDCLAAQCKRHNLPAELIIVEWNPPADRPPLAEALRWPTQEQGGAMCAVRIITVPREIHARYKHGKHLPLYQMIAKNVGIRRARGEFVLATNIDVILNDDLAAFIARRQLQKGKMYRIDRTDADASVPENAPIDQVLEYCRSHVLRINAREGTFSVGPDGLRAVAPLDIASHEAVASLGMGWYEPQRTTEGQPYRWVENDAEIWLRGPGVAAETAPGFTPQPMYVCLDVQPGPGAGEGPFRLSALDASGRTLASQYLFHRQNFNFPVTVAAGELERIVLHADRFTNPPRRIAPDPRQLNFMTHRIEVVHTAPAEDGAGRADITGEGVKTGRGWYEQEEGDGELFRWFDTGAEIWIEPMAHGFLNLELAPGPSLDNLPFSLHVEQSGAEAKDILVMGRRMISIPLADTSAESLRKLTLSVESPRRTVGGDTRILNVKVYHMQLADEPAPRTQVENDVEATGVDVAFAKGWHYPEHLGGQWSRWGENDAVLMVGSLPDRKTKWIDLDLHPGPSQGENPVDLRIEDAAGNVLGTLAGSSGVIRLPLRGPVDRLILHVDSPNLPVRKDSRILNFLLRGIVGVDDGEQEGVVEKPEEIVQAAAKPPVRKQEENPALPTILPAHLHTNACGDFTLLHRDHWFELRGYAEWDVFSLNIDSLFCFTAHHGGAVEEILPEPMRLYHIEHSVGSGWTPEGQQLLLDRIHSQGIPDVHWTEVIHLGSLMNAYDAPILFCRENWGLLEDDLPETIAVAGGIPQG
jgi:hypothetical protein